MYPPLLPSLDSPELPDRPLLLSPFIRRGDLCLVTGAKGSGKTTFLLDLVACLTLPSHDTDGRAIEGANTMLAGAFRLTKDWHDGFKILIIDAENDLTEWRTILNDTLAARGIEHDSIEATRARQRTKYMSAEYFPWNDLVNFRKNFDAFFEAIVATEPVQAVIIDSVHKLWTQDLNSPTWAVEGLGWMRKRFQEWGVTTFAIVHTSRDFEGKLPGNRFLPGYTSRQENEADCILGLERMVKDNALKVHLVKRRSAKWNAEGTYLRVNMSPTYGGYAGISTAGNPWLHERPDATIRNLTRVELTTLSKLSRVDVPFTYADFGPSINKSRLRRTLEALIASHFCEHLSGDGTKTSPKVFALTDDGLAAYRASRPSKPQEEAA